METHVIKVSWQSHEAALRAIREDVFIVEQEVDPADEWDEEDKVAWHFLAVNEIGQYLGCSRLATTGQIGRMAVLKSHRGTGLGAELLNAAVQEGKEQGMTRLFLHAQTYAEAFYQKGGFIRCGEGFEEVGIPHVPMEMKLPLPFNAPKVTARPKVRPQPVEADNASSPEHITNLSEAISGLNETINQARREVLILSPWLDHQLFDHDDIIQSISNMARNATRARIQIIIMSSKLIVDRGHRLLDLARRLDDKIQIRLLAEDIREDTASFVCADTDAYWLLPDHAEPNGVYDLANPVTTQRLKEAFHQAWEKSRSDPELRVLHL